MGVLRKTVSRKTVHQKLCQSDQNHIKDRMGFHFYSGAFFIKFSRKAEQWPELEKVFKNSSVNFKIIFVRMFSQINLT